MGARPLHIFRPILLITVVEEEKTWKLYFLVTLYYKRKSEATLNAKVKGVKSKSSAWKAIWKYLLNSTDSAMY